ncbi:MAG: 2,4-dihydroxyhept-2-ene-1,7-dioic acid aldolase (EC, partial [uncultured Acetobacteraceae bacterium]
ADRHQPRARTPGPRRAGARLRRPPPARRRGRDAGRGGRLRLAVHRHGARRHVRAGSHADLDSRARPRRHAHRPLLQGRAVRGHARARQRRHGRGGAARGHGRRGARGRRRLPIPAHRPPLLGRPALRLRLEGARAGGGASRAEPRDPRRLHGGNAGSGAERRRDRGGAGRGRAADRHLRPHRLHGHRRPDRPPRRARRLRDGGQGVRGGGQDARHGRRVRRDPRRRLHQAGRALPAERVRPHHDHGRRHRPQPLPARPPSL